MLAVRPGHQPEEDLLGVGNQVVGAAGDRLEFRLLGPLEALWDGQPLSLGGSKQRAVLAILLLHAGEVMSPDGLIDALWGADPPATAANIVQTYVSRLRKVLNREEPVLFSRRPGYILNVGPGQLDLDRFAQLAERGRRALEAGRGEEAAGELGKALDLWRGSPLAEFAYEEFAQREIERLEEMRLSVLEDRIEAELATGHHGQIVGELDDLVTRHPMRERLVGQLMRALYRAGRQAEALEIYQRTKSSLADELGIDPGPDLRRLEEAILKQDPELDWVPARSTPTQPRQQTPVQPRARPPEPAPDRSILVAPVDEVSLRGLIAMAEPLAATSGPHEVILAWLLPTSAGSSDLVAVTSELNRHRSELWARGVACRAVSFTSANLGPDLERMALQYATELVLIHGENAITDSGLFQTPVLDVLDGVSSDVAVLLEGAAQTATDPSSPVLVPFGGGDHDWVALQLGAWVASAHGVSLRLLGTTAEGQEGRRDSSRLLAEASLIAQRTTGVLTEPLLVGSPDELTEAAQGAGLLVVGLSDRWREEGLGPVRWSIAAASVVPTLFLRRGARSAAPGSEAQLSRYTWSRAAR